MIQLSSEDQQALRDLSRCSSHDDIERTLKEIAGRQSVDWEGWLDWKGPKRPSFSLLSWAAVQFDSTAYIELVEFAFRRFLPTLVEPEAATHLCKMFADSIRAAQQWGLASNDFSEEAAQERCVEAIAVALAGKPSESRLAYAALSFATGPVDDVLMKRGWQTAASWAAQSNLKEDIKVPGRAGDGPTTL